ncbi:MAG: signal peptidase II [Candidatus Wallacebacter cryptica]
MLYKIAIAAIIVLDQLSKLLISTNFVIGERIRLLPYVYLTYVENVGAAFGLFANYRWLFIGLGLVVLFLTWYYRKEIKKQNKLFQWGIALAIAGTIGNLIDRIRIGAVIDFIDITIFPIFNIADMSIVAGVALLFLEVLINEWKANS